MNARRFGVSTIWAMFSRVRSKISGSSCSSRNRSTSAANARCSGENSKSMRRDLTGPSGDDALGPQVVELRLGEFELAREHGLRVLTDEGHARLGAVGHLRQLHRIPRHEDRLSLAVAVEARHLNEHV